MSALLIDDAVRAALKELAQRAEASPIWTPDQEERLKDPVEYEKHQKFIDSVSLAVPVNYWVVYTIEDGQPIGRCRHVSVAVLGRPGRTPVPQAVMMIAQILGFHGNLEDMDDIRVLDQRVGSQTVQAVHLMQSMPSDTVQ